MNKGLLEKNIRVNKKSIYRWFSLDCIKSVMVGSVLFLLTIPTLLVTILFARYSNLGKQVDTILRRYENPGAFVINSDNYNNKWMSQKVPVGGATHIGHLAFEDIVNEIFATSHEGDYYKLEAAVYEYDKELYPSEARFKSDVGYPVYVSQYSEHLIKEGRMYEGDAHEAIVYGNKVPLGGVVLINEVQYTVVGKLEYTIDLLVEGGIVTLDEEERVAGLSRLSEEEMILINPNCEHVKNAIVADAPIVFDMDAYSEEEIEKMKFYGEVQDFKYRTASVKSVFYTGFRYVLLVAWAILFVVLSFWNIKISHRKQIENIKLLRAHEANEKDIRFAFIRPHICVLLLGLFISWKVIDVMFWRIDILSHMCILFACVVLVWTGIMLYYMNNNWKYGYIVEAAYIKEDKLLISNMSVLDNIALVFQLRNNESASESRHLAYRYIDGFEMHKIQDRLPEDLREFDVKLVRFAMQVAREERDGKDVIVKNIFTGEDELKLVSEKIDRFQRALKFRVNFETVNDMPKDEEC